MQRLGLFLYVLAAISACGALMGIVVGPQWIEQLTGFEPDGGNGSLEYLVVLAPAVLAVVLMCAGRLVRHRSHAY